SGAIRQRHLEWYADQSDRAAIGLQGADQRRWLARLDADAANIWEAARWAVAAIGPGEPDRWARVVHAQPLLSRIWRYWFARGAATEAYGWLRRLLDDLGTPPDSPEVRRARGFALGSACVL